MGAKVCKLPKSKFEICFIDKRNERLFSVVLNGES